MSTALPRALVADDDPDLLLLVSTRLEGLGYAVSRAPDGLTALDLAGEVRPQIAVLDVAMPGMDGLELTRRLLADPCHAGMAVILLTARTGEADIDRGYDAGATAYITKPFSLREFEESVRRVQAERAEWRDLQTARAFAAAEAAYARVAGAVASEALPHTVFGLVAEEAATLIGAQAGRVVMYREPGRARLVGTWRRPPLRAEPEQPEIVLAGESALSEVRATGTPAHAHVPGSTLPHRLAVPVRVAGVLWGAVALAADRPDPFDDPVSEERLRRFAHLVGLALANAEARSQLATMAATDHLTGLANQRSFQDRLEHEFARGLRHGRALSLVVLDIDRFKAVNDRHGHDVGDIVLGEVARRLAAHIRVGETMARIGGEEFAWILPEADAPDAMAAAERARRAVRATPIAGVGRVTVSAGVCDAADAGDAPELFHMADVALYWAKRGGRDRVVRYTSSAVERFADDEEARRRERDQSLIGVAALARAVDAKHGSTIGHADRVARLAARLADAAGWGDERAGLLAEAGLLHDVGKIGVPDRILLKPGRLDGAEHELVSAHVTAGAGILSGILSDEQCAWVRGHHERHDGGGYPDGLAGDAIPDGARLLALAEAWDAMTAVTTYREPLPPEAALEECRREAGFQFAPAAVAALERVIAEDAR